MKLVYLLFVGFLLSSCSNGNDQKWESGDKAEKNTKEKTKKVLEATLDTCQCDLLSFDQNGVAQYQDTIFHGKCHSYNKGNGNKYEERMYLNGVIEWAKFYNNMGEQIIQYDYENGKKIEFTVSCDCNDIQFKEVNGEVLAHHKGKIFDGHCQSYYPKINRRYQEGKYLNGKKDGVHAIYDKQGEVLTYEYYDNGELVATDKK